MWVRVGVGVRGVISDKLSRTNSSCLRADFGIGWLTRLLTSLKESIIWRTNIKRINHRFCLFELGSKAEFRPHVPCVPQDRRNTTNWPTLKSSSFAEKCLGTPSRFRPDRKINTQESSLGPGSTKSSIVKWSYWLDIFDIKSFFSSLNLDESAFCSQGWSLRCQELVNKAVVLRWRGGPCSRSHKLEKNSLKAKYENQ